MQNLLDIKNKAEESESSKTQTLSLNSIELSNKKKKTVPSEYAKPILDAWQRIHKLQDGTDPLTKTDYAILQQTIKKLFQDNIPLGDVLGTIEDIGELAKTSSVWALAKPPVILKHISSYRAGILKRQIEFERSKNTARKGVSYEYKPEHDFRRRQV